MAIRKCGNSLFEIRVFVTVFFVLMLFGYLIDAAGDIAYAKERIVLKGVPYFCQKWHFD